MSGLRIFCIASALLAAPPFPGFAADLRKAPPQAPAPAAVEIAEVPGDDIFGFTSPSDVGNVGDRTIVLENTGRFNKRDGSYGSVTSKLEFGRTLDTNLWGALSGFGTWHRVSNVTGINDNISRATFDGLSGEIEYRILRRSAGNPFAASLSFEPRWGRADSVTGQLVNSFSGEAKLFVDAVIMPDRLFWALNLNYAPGVQQIIGDKSHWAATSGANVSSGLTAQLGDNLFVGVEARYLTAFNRPFLNNLAGQALFAGPNFLYKFSKTVAFNSAWTPQIAGRAQALKDRTFDLDNFERHQVRAKLAVQF